MSNMTPAPRPYDIHVSLWDLDNCIANDQWRLPFIDHHLPPSTRYHRYNEQLGMDQREHYEHWRLMTAMSRPVFLTGRQELFRESTLDWLVDNLPVDRPGGNEYMRREGILLLMRANDDFSKPVDLKRRMLSKLVREHHISLDRVIGAFDDLPSIVEMYLEHGIPATVLRCYDPVLSYEPQDL